LLPNTPCLQRLVVWEGHFDLFAMRIQSDNDKWTESLRMYHMEDGWFDRKTEITEKKELLDTWLSVSNERRRLSCKYRIAYRRILHLLATVVRDDGARLFMERS
jgi:hypothetical protein